jgi:cellulose 1,4-beta-cellobiosidase
MLKDSGAPNMIAPFVVYNLPDRDCAATVSYRELRLANNGEQLYRDYIDTIQKSIKSFPDINVVLIIEPDALANVITNADIPKCAEAASAYRSLVTYAVK